MTHRIFSMILTVCALQFVFNGCVSQSDDPLLFDENRQVRGLVSEAELAEHGIDSSCRDWEFEISTSDDVLRIPIQGVDEKFLVGLNGIALCMETAPIEDLSDVELGDELGLDRNEPMSVSDENNSDMGNLNQEDLSGALDNVNEMGQRRPAGNPRLLIYDPTPEPATE